MSEHQALGDHYTRGQLWRPCRVLALLSPNRPYKAGNGKCNPVFDRWNNKGTMFA